MAKKTLLVVDDSADTRLVVGARLMKHGYDTVFAADALQAIAIARQTQPDAIILDLGLPGGNGFIVLQRLKANTTLASIPVIILTSDESLENELKGLEAGATAFLHKPAQEEALIAAVGPRSAALRNVRSPKLSGSIERTVPVTPSPADPQGILAGDSCGRRIRVAGATVSKELAPWRASITPHAISAGKEVSHDDGAQS